MRNRVSLKKSAMSIRLKRLSTLGSTTVEVEEDLFLGVGSLPFLFSLLELLFEVVMGVESLSADSSVDPFADSECPLATSGASATVVAAGAVGVVVAAIVTVG